MKRILFFITLLAMILFESCELKKTYSYIAIVSEESIFGGTDIKEKEPEKIMAISDSAAYIDAYESFCISQKVHNDMKESYGRPFTTPIRFKLLDNEGNDITCSVFFENKDSLETAIRNEIFSMRNSLSESVDISKDEIVRDSIQQAKFDSIQKAKAEREAYLNRPWKTSYYVDEFGDRTGEDFIKYKTTGKFSNSATSNSNLYVEVFIDRNNAGIFLHEYSADRPAEKPIGTWTIMLKNSAGSVLKLRTSSEWNQKGGVSISPYAYGGGASDVGKLKYFLKKSVGNVKVVINSEYSSQYRFDIDATGFTAELAKI